MLSPSSSLLPSADLPAEYSQLGQVLRDTPVALASSAGPEHRLTFFNDQYQANAAGRAVLGRPVAECLPEVVPQGFIALLDEVYRTGQAHSSHETRVELLDEATGQLAEHFYDFSFQPLRGTTGEIEGILGFCTDITTQKNQRSGVKQKLDEQREFYETLLREAPAGLAAFDADHRYLFANTVTSPEAGFQHWMIGKTSLETCVTRGYEPEIADKREACFAEALRERHEVKWEETLPGPAGPRLWMRRMRPVFHPDGTLRMMISLGIDITERRRAEALVQQQQAVIQRILDSIPNPIFVTDTRGHHTFTNAAQMAVRQQLLRRLELVEQGVAVMPEAGAGAAMRQRVLDTGQEAVGDISCTLDSGELRDYQVVVRPLPQLDGELHALTVATDVTALKQAQRAANDAAQARENFLATMSHEIRTPLNGVLGMAGLLAKTPLAPDQQRYLDVVQHSGRLLMAILNDVLDMAKITAGQLQLETVPTDLRQSLEQTAATLSPLAAEKGLSLVVELLEVAPPVLTDPYRLGQVLLNLLSNAIKFTERGYVALHADLRADTPAQLTVHFCVRDTGPGLAPEAQEHVFDAFAQASADTTRRFGGTGLGLAISSRLVQQLGGHLVVCSELGQGSIFGFTVTFDKAPAPAQNLPTAELTDEAAVRGWRVLLVDDNALNLELAQAVLAQNGLVVDAAGSGVAALALFEQHRYDIVLMDIHMPGMSGLEATAHIRAHADPARAATPVLGLTADAFQAQHEGYRAAGMSDVITKPFGEAELLRKLVAARAPG